MTATFEAIVDAYSTAEDQFERHWSDCCTVAQSLREDIANILGISASEVKFVRRKDIELSRERNSDDVPKQFNDASAAADLTPDGQFQIGACFGVPYRNEPDSAWYLILPLRITKREASFAVFSEALPIEFPVGCPPQIETRKFAEQLIKHLIEDRKGSFQRFFSGTATREIGFHTISRKKK